MLPDYSEWCYRTTGSDATTLQWVMLPHYREWCYHTTVRDATTLQGAMLPHYREWCYHTTVRDATTLQGAMLPHYRERCYHTTVSDATALQGVMLPHYREWCYHTTEGDAIALQFTSELAQITSELAQFTSVLAQFTSVLAQITSVIALCSLPLWISCTVHLYHLNWTDWGSQKVEWVTGENQLVMFLSVDGSDGFPCTADQNVSICMYVHVCTLYTQTHYTPTCTHTPFNIFICIWWHFILLCLKGFPISWYLWSGNCCGWSGD